MANPQIENGYTRIANELLDAICRIRIPGEAHQVFNTIIRKTYGYGKTEDRIALSQLCDATGLKKATVCKATAKLVLMNLIIKNTDGSTTSYIINKDFDTWRPLPKKVTLPKKEIAITQKDNTSLPKKGHTIENTTKETITKEITTNVVTAKQPVREVSELIIYLKSKLGSDKLDGSDKQNRQYAWHCLKKFGPDPPTAFEHTKKIIDLAFKDPFHAARCTEIKYIFYNGMKIVASAKEKLSTRRGKQIV